MHDLLADVSHNDSDDHDDKDDKDDDHNYVEEDNDDTEDEVEEEEENDDSTETLDDFLPRSKKMWKFTSASRLHKRKKKKIVLNIGDLSRNERIPKAIVLQRANIDFKSKSVNPCFVVFFSAVYVAATFMVTFLYPSQILQTSIC